MKKVESLLIGVSVLLFIVAPYLPTSLYFLVFNNVVGPFVLLGAVLLSVGYSKVGSVALILAIGALFIEHRKRAMSILHIVANTKKEEPAAIDQIVSPPPIIPTEIHPPFEIPDESIVGYRPLENQTNDFDAVGSSINTKTDLGGVRLPEKTEQFLIEHGLAEKQSD
jgi:hypothetical protein